MELYHYNSDGYLVHVSAAADTSTGLPPNCTIIAPPPAQAGKVSKWSPSVGTWVQVNKPVEVPAEVAMWKAKSIIEAQGYLTEAETLISQMTGADGVVAKHKWAHATVVSRKDSVVAGIQAAMGWSDAVVDGMFIAAANLK